MSQYPDSIQQKDPRILELLHELEASMPAGSYQIVDYWDADLCAIGVASKSDPRRLVYVSTYGQQDGAYAFECEAPPDEASADFQVTDQGDGLMLETLLQKIRAHLRRGAE
jgi:hypothetical protein